MGLTHPDDFARLGAIETFKPNAVCAQLHPQAETDGRIGPERTLPSFRSFGLHEFTTLKFPPRDYVLSPILPLKGLAMLYAARAALSEREIYAKTHRGAWHEFRREFVETEKIDPSLAAAVQKVQPEREQADYDAWEPSSEEARRVIEMAGAFLAAVEELLA